MTTEFEFSVDDNISYDPTKYKRGTQKRTFDIDKIKVGSSILVSDRAERGLVTSSFNYYCNKYPDLYGHMTVRSVPEGEAGYRVFFLDKSKV
jgi:hypothetical protein